MNNLTGTQSYIYGKMQECGKAIFYLYEQVDSFKNDEGKEVRKRVLYLSENFYPELVSTKKALILISCFSCRLAASLFMQQLNMCKDFKTVDNLPFEVNVNFKPPKITK